MLRFCDFKNLYGIFNLLLFLSIFYHAWFILQSLTLVWGLLKLNPFKITVQVYPSTLEV